MGVWRWSLTIDSLGLGQAGSGALCGNTCRQAELGLFHVGGAKMEEPVKSKQLFLTLMAALLVVTGILGCKKDDTAVIVAKDKESGVYTIAPEEP